MILLPLLLPDISRAMFSKMKHRIEILSLLLLLQVWMNKSTSNNCTVEVHTESDGKINVNLQCPRSPNCPVCITHEGSTCCITQNATTTICSIDGLHQSCKQNTPNTVCVPPTVTLTPTPSSCMPRSAISSMLKTMENHYNIKTKETITAFEISTVYTTILVYPSITSPTEPTAMTPSCHNITAALGSMAGMFMVMITMVTVGCILIWWKTEKKRRLTIGSKQTSFPNTRSIINTLNHTDKTLRQINNPLYCQGGPDELPQPPTTDRIEPQSVIQPEDWEPTYEAIPLHGKKNRSFEMSEHVISHHKANGDKQIQAHRGVSVGVAPLEECGHGALELELSQVGLEGEDIENHYHLIGSEELDRQSGQELRDADIENHYHLIDMREEEKNCQMMKDNNCRHILEQNTSISQEKSDVGTIESDYYLLGSVEEAAEQEREESVYHVLEMPGNDDNDYEDPDEGDLFRDYDERKRERETERSTREPCAYKVPVKS